MIDITSILFTQFYFYFSIKITMFPFWFILLHEMENHTFVSIFFYIFICKKYSSLQLIRSEFPATFELVFDFKKYGINI